MNGMHYRHSCDVGQTVGRHAADYVLDNFLCHCAEGYDVPVQRAEPGALNSPHQPNNCCFAVPKGQARIAQPFNAGLDAIRSRVPKGRLRRACAAERSGLRVAPVAAQAAAAGRSNPTPPVFQPSLRDLCAIRGVSRRYNAGLFSRCPSRTKEGGDRLFGEASNPKLLWSLEL